MQIGETIKDKAPPRFDSQADRVAYLLAEYKTPITISAIAGLLLFLSGRFSIPEIPDIWSVWLLGIAAGAVPAAVIGKVAIVDPFVPEPIVRVAVVDLENGGVRAEKVPKQLWADRSRGERSAWAPDEGNIDYVVSEFDYMEDLHKLSVEGVNRELVDPIDLIVRDQRIEEVHQDLQATAAEYQRYQARERTRRLERDREIVTSLIAAVEHGLEFEPGTEEAIQNNSLSDIPDDKPGDTGRTDEPQQADTPTLNQILGYEDEALSDEDTDPMTNGHGDRQ